MKLEKALSAPSQLYWTVPAQVGRIPRSINDKRKIVLESLSSPISIAAVARARDINPNLLHTWRWHYRLCKLDEPPSHTTLVSVTISTQATSRVKPREVKQPDQPGCVEIIMGDARVLVRGMVQVEVLRTIRQARER